MKKNYKRKILLTVVGLGLIALLSVMLRPSSIRVETARVDRGSLEVMVEEQGRTRSRYRHTVAAPVGGRLLRTSVDEGDRVASGTVLTKIAPPPENTRAETTLRAELLATQARRKEAEALLVEARSQRDLAQDEAQRRSELSNKGLVSVETRDAYIRAVDVANARVDSAEASLEVAKADVSGAQARLMGINKNLSEDALTPVITPVTGVVLRVYEESERVLQAGAPLFDISKNEELEVIVDFLTQDAVKIQAGDTMKITGWGGDEQLLGKIRHVEPGAFTKISTLGVEEQRVNVIGDIANAPPSLGAEFRLEVAVVVWTGDNVLRVPTTAIFRRGSAWNTFVVENGLAQLRTIDIGQRGSDFAEVTSGLSEDEVVILFPSDLIENDVKVEFSE